MNQIRLLCALMCVQSTHAGSLAHILPQARRRSASGEEHAIGESRAHVSEEGWVTEMCERLQVCQKCSELQDIIYSEHHRFAPANLKCAFQALVRVCFQQQLPVRVKGGLTDAWCEALLTSPLPDTFEDCKQMGVIVLAHALDIVMQLTPSHMVAILQGMALLEIMVESDVMLDLVRHVVLTLDDCTAHDIEDVLVGLALLEHQPEETSLVAFENHVAILSSQFDSSAQISLLWSFSKLGRETEVVQAVGCYHTRYTDVVEARYMHSPETRMSSRATCHFSRVRAKAMILPRQELRDSFHGHSFDGDSFHGKLWRCPLIMRRHTAVPPKHLHESARSVLEMNARPPFSLRFTQPWVAEKLQRANEHRQHLIAHGRPMLKGKRDTHMREMRIINMHKRFMAEDHRLVIDPDRTDKDQQLRDCLLHIKDKYQTALKEWRSCDNAHQAALQQLAQRLNARVEQKRGDLQEALADKAAGMTPAVPAQAPAAHDANDVGDWTEAGPTMMVAKVMWAHFGKHLFSAPCPLPPHTDGTLLTSPAITTMSEGPGSWPHNTLGLAQRLEDKGGISQRLAKDDGEGDGEDDGQDAANDAHSSVSKTLAHGTVSSAHADDKDQGCRDRGDVASSLASSLDAPLIHYFELYLNGQSTLMRTAAIPWAHHAEWYDSFTLTTPQKDVLVEFVWHYQMGHSGERYVGAAASLEWSTVEMPAVGAPLVLSLDLFTKDIEMQKVGRCCVDLSQKEGQSYGITRSPSDTLIPGKEEVADKCLRLLNNEIAFAQKTLKEAQKEVDAAQVVRWQTIADLQEQYDEGVEARKLERRVFGLPPSHSPHTTSLQADTHTARRPTSSRGGGRGRGASESLNKGAQFAKAQVFYSGTSKDTEWLRIGVFDTPSAHLHSPTSPATHPPTHTPAHKSRYLESTTSSNFTSPRTPRTPHTRTFRERAKGTPYLRAPHTETTTPHMETTVSTCTSDMTHTPYLGASQTDATSHLTPHTDTSMVTSNSASTPAHTQPARTVWSDTCTPRAHLDLGDSLRMHSCDILATHFDYAQQPAQCDYAQQAAAQHTGWGSSRASLQQAVDGGAESIDTSRQGMHT